MYKYNYSPGPSFVRENVRMSRALEVTNPDLDKDFVDYYKETCDLFNKIVNSNNETYILSGEAILGLEAACASLTEDGDRVLVLDNGIYGNGFKDFVSMYGGTPVLFSRDRRRAISVDELRTFLEKDSDFKYATIVHCDTPTSVVNNINEICPLLKEYGILSVVDSVSGMVGEYVNTDEAKIDILLGGSQKAISAQPGITVVSVSDDAKIAMSNRKTPIRAFYANLRIWENYLEERYFPYTLPTSDIVSFRCALENIYEEGIENVLNRHEKVADAVRKSIKECGVSLFLESDFSNTVTAIEMPEGISALKVVNTILEKNNVIVATSLAEYEDKIIRIGHMGENARFERTYYTLKLLDEAFTECGLDLKNSIAETFAKYYL